MPMTAGTGMGIGTGPVKSTRNFHIVFTLLLCSLPSLDQWFGLDKLDIQTSQLCPGHQLVEEEVKEVLGEHGAAQKF